MKKGTRKSYRKHDIQLRFNVYDSKSLELIKSHYLRIFSLFENSILYIYFIIKCLYNYNFFIF